METIKIYLENMFKTLPNTAELRKLKGEILGNMEEKYQELKAEGKTENEAIGIVISEFGNIDEIIKEFGIKVEENKENSSKPLIQGENIREYLRLKKKTSFIVSIGVMLCMLGGAILITLSQLMEEGLIFKSLVGDAKDFAMVTPVLILVAIAVGLFIFSGAKMEKYEYIEKGRFTIQRSERFFLEEEKQRLSGTKTMGIIMGVCLCVLSPIVIFITGIYSERAITYGAAVVVLIVSVAVFLFINLGGCDDGHKKLLKEGEYSDEVRKNNKVIGAVASIVWPLAVAVFLLWSFIFNAWGISWIVFPVTGVIFGGFAAVYTALHGKEESF